MIIRDADNGAADKVWPGIAGRIEQDRPGLSRINHSVG
jgi:hypothetical protein